MFSRIAIPSSRRSKGQPSALRDLSATGTRAIGGYLGRGGVPRGAESGRSGHRGGEGAPEGTAGGESSRAGARGVSEDNESESKSDSAVNKGYIEEVPDLLASTWSRVPNRERKQAVRGLQAMSKRARKAKNPSAPEPRLPLPIPGLFPSLSLNPRPRGQRNGREKRLFSQYLDNMATAASRVNKRRERKEKEQIEKVTQFGKQQTLNCLLEERKIIENYNAILSSKLEDIEIDKTINGPILLIIRELRVNCQKRENVNSIVLNDQETRTKEQESRRDSQIYNDRSTCQGDASAY